MDIQEHAEDTGRRLIRRKIYNYDSLYLFQIYCFYILRVYARHSVVWADIKNGGLGLPFVLLVLSLGAMIGCFRFLARCCVLQPAIRYLFSKRIYTRKKFSKYFLKGLIFLSTMVRTGSSTLHW